MTDNIKLTNTKLGIDNIYTTKSLKNKTYN